MLLLPPHLFRAPGDHGKLWFTQDKGAHALHININMVLEYSFRKAESSAPEGCLVCPGSGIRKLPWAFGPCQIHFHTGLHWT